MANSRLEQLVEMSKRLGDPALDYVILGEGTASARIDHSTFGGETVVGVAPDKC